MLKPGGTVCVADMRRDVNPLLKWGIYATVQPRAIRPGYLSSLNAAYTVGEMTEVMRNTAFERYTVEKNFFGLTVSATK